MEKTIKVLWFSRHTMTDIQNDAMFIGIARHFQNDLQETTVIITQVSETINSISEIDDIGGYDVYAIVAPISLQQQFLIVAVDKPVIIAKYERIIAKTP